MTNWARVHERYALKRDMGMVKCPAHDDAHESLSVKRKGDDVLTHCFAGCHWKAVREALGLTFTPQANGHMADRPTLPPKRLEATHRYTNTAGDVVAEKRRIRMPDGTKRFEWSSLDATGTMRVGFDKAKGESQGMLNLYGLLVAVEGAKLGNPVFVVEGEKCVDLLDTLGLFAVTNPEGASGAASAYASWRFDSFPPHTLFVLLPDNDAAGAKHAAKLADVIGPRFACHVLTLPNLGPKDDVADYVAAQRANAVPDATIAATLHVAKVYLINLVNVILDNNILFHILLGFSWVWIHMLVLLSSHWTTRKCGRFRSQLTLLMSLITSTIKPLFAVLRILIRSPSLKRFCARFLRNTVS